MGVLLADIPGLTEAVAEARAEERRLRDLAFLDVPVEICGIEVQQFRPRHYQLLVAGESPFLQGGKIGLDHVLQLLWVVSPMYRAGDAELMRAYGVDTWKRLPLLSEVKPAIFRYLDDALLDMHKGGKADAAPIAGFAAHLVHLFGKAYGWKREETLDTPFHQLHQLQRLIDRDEAAELGLRVSFANSLSDRVEKWFVKQWKAAQKAAAAAIKQ